MSFGTIRTILSVAILLPALPATAADVSPPTPVTVGSVIEATYLPSIGSAKEAGQEKSRARSQAPASFGTGESTWIEDAENGSGNVIDGTDASYPLIQADRVAQGSNAFSLANPGFADNWFVLDVDIDVQAGTKLFFQSRLQWATSAQVAKVQVSTNGGSSWSATVYSQAGSGGSGEGAFALREVDLGTTYAGQQVRIRFLYDFTGGSAFTQVGSNVGWLVDDIQIGEAFTKAQWSIGAPTATEVLYLEIINRARADALAEASRLAALTDTNVTGAYAYFGVNPADIISQFAWYVSGCMDQYAQPLAFQSQLMEAARKHSQDMFNNQFQEHDSSSNPVAPFQPGDTFGQRLDRVGYSGGAGENIYAYAKSVEHGHAGFDVDWGNTTNTSSSCYNSAFAGQGMQNPAGHRTNIHNGSFNEAGIGVVNGTNGSVGPQIVTQDLGRASGVSYITGVVYDDDDANNFYSASSDSNHEGRGGIRVDVEGAAVYVVSTDSGAYAIPVDGDGTYTVTFSGAGIETYTTTVTLTGGQNIKLDHNPVDASRYAQWAASHGLSGGPLDDDDRDGVANIVESAVLNMDPTVPDGEAMPSFTKDPDGTHRLTLYKQAEATDLAVSVLVSTDLENWVPAGTLAGTTVETDTASELTVAVDATHVHLFAKFNVDFIE